MDVDTVPPPRRAVSDAAQFRVVARWAGAILLTVVVACALVWLVAALTQGLLNLAGAFATTGAHAGVAVALVVLFACLLPLLVVCAAVALRRLARPG